jgi:hypothetical protein
VYQIFEMFPTYFLQVRYYFTYIKTWQARNVEEKNIVTERKEIGLLTDVRKQVIYMAET